MRRYHSLSWEQQQIILHKGTEYPGTGSFYKFDRPGIYLCKQCDLPLYLSQNKFASGCGWPSFDEEIKGSVVRQLDDDGVRVEILCSRCHCHLGHVFLNENFTKKNTRHCVNSLSLSFVDAITEDGYFIAYFAAGCFWGVEYFFKEVKNVKRTRVGYMGGNVVNPLYEEVLTGLTGHVETLEVIYSSEEAYSSLVELFFEIHDPTQKDRQGPDIGSQYQSSLFFLTEKQKDVAEEKKRILERKGLCITTQIMPASRFYPAETYHQHYYEKTGQNPYCHFITKRF